MYSRQAYRFEKPILYNNVNTESLYGAVIEPENVAYIAPLGRCIRAGSFLATGDRLLPRARIISPYTSDSNNVIVSNPAVFKPGDVLRLIGTSSSTPQQEAAAVFQGTAVSFGTIVSVDASLVHQVVTCTVGNVSPGNIFILLIEGVSLSCTATTSNSADVVSALKSVFDAAWGQTLGFAEIRVSAEEDTLT
ncbi:hypothetical protein [Brasilonema sp. UFV-L1]|uniref:hypothetical protein n=1 Tax=Brasilonema sp. UFV-L1 TaxID=2234130 RepID=UPI00145F90DF|nr:hypothetical protein [Brasilonema sp. UFV-L1]NMG10713.1 hypothetical protein [Brasilonema sp. UFV-L1]